MLSHTHQDAVFAECIPDYFLGPHASLGQKSVSVRLGHFTYQLQNLAEHMEKAASIYRPFLTDAPADHTIDIRQGKKQYLDYLQDGLLRTEQRHFPEGEVLVSTHFAAFRPAAGNTGTLLISEPDNTKLALGAIENYLRWTVANVELPLGSFVLHCAGLVRDGKAYIFFGHSGAGKSTVTALSTDATVLSDDLVLLQRLSTGWHAATTPFAGEFSQEKKTLGSYPVAGIFMLKKSPDVKAVQMNRSIAVAALLSCCPFVDEPARSQHLMPLIEDLAAKVPCHELHFRKDLSFWNVVLKKMNL